ncbi:MAG: type II toxin-antitoxin system VapC family toxin [Actinomycetota bacterium]|nr:type II toxin-antitoxin system VapC family toxin [Rubrobacteraceae bacterium]MBA3635935.1 type II toxin-antitoxin system VapC family toxin [Rubrobacteraceae bacterium]MBA3703467.1 type II toxin-antitoxin system VapC family toxin [Rubrobacteraceae bacterium]MDQ3497237.1 type II toxin-antitoxin system VapC family toxin [Actinomycetota bacterium]
MKALLDTHAFLWWISDDRRLSDRAREFIGDGRNELFFSAASGWEISIKAGLGRLEVPGDLQRFIADQLSRNAIKVLPIYLSHTLHTRVLPDHHRDPFDRILASQAILEEMPLLSADPKISHYPVEVVW